MMNLTNETVNMPGKWSFVTHRTPPTYITKSLEPKVLPSESRHHDLAILPFGGMLCCHLIQSCRKCQKMASSCLASTGGGGGGVLFCPTFRYHQFDDAFQWCMKCVQSCVKIFLEKFMSRDLTNIETFFCGGFSADLNPT